MKFLVILILIIGLFPLAASYSQLQDKAPTLGIILTSFTPYHYTDDDGYTIIIGEVQNTKNFPVTGVKIWAGFYNDVNLQPLESTVGTSLLEVIPANGKSPYVIKSPTKNSAITNISVNLLGFNSAGVKPNSLNLKTTDTVMGESISFTGTITNNGGVKSANTKVHLIFYDAFTPPRLLKISSIDLGTIEPKATMEFTFTEKRINQASGFKILSESDSFSSNVLNAQVTPPEILSKSVSINDISITDNDGNLLSSLTKDTPVNIQSNMWIQIASESESYEQEYVYYAQVVQSGKPPYVEFIGTYEGKFEGPNSHMPSVEWIPEKSGLYYVETYIWDPNGIALGSKGPIHLVLVN